MIYLYNEQFLRSDMIDDIGTHFLAFIHIKIHSIPQGKKLFENKTNRII